MTRPRETGIISLTSGTNRPQSLSLFASEPSTSSLASAPVDAAWPRSRHAVYYAHSVNATEYSVPYRKCRLSQREKKPRFYAALPSPAHPRILHNTLLSWSILVAQQNPSSQTQVAPYCVWMSRTDSYEQSPRSSSIQSSSRHERHPSHFPARRNNPKTTHTITDCQETTTTTFKVPPDTVPLYCG